MKRGEEKRREWKEGMSDDGPTRMQGVSGNHLISNHTVFSLTVAPRVVSRSLFVWCRVGDGRWSISAFFCSASQPSQASLCFTQSLTS